jgi:hypothetical protein
MAKAVLLTLLLALAGMASPWALADRKHYCGNEFPGAVDCYVHALAYAYRMCHQVQSIAVIEYGLDGAHQGTNGKKYEFCVDKQRRLVTGLLREALRAARNDGAISTRIRALHSRWERSLAELPPAPGEQIETYNTRVLSPYFTLAQEGSELRYAHAAIRTPVRSRPRPAKTAAVARADLPPSTVR